MVSKAVIEPEVERLKDALAQAKNEILLLRQQIDWLKKQLFGSGKSERVDSAQLELLLQGLESQLEQAQSAVEPQAVPPVPREVQRREPRERKYGHLPVLEERIIEPQEVLRDPDAFELVGEEETFEVDVQPPKFFRRRLLYRKYRRKDDRCAALLVAPAPVRPVAGIASIGLLAYLVVGKYVDHLPLARQSRIYERSGVKLAPQSMVRWVEVVADWLKPIYCYMRQELLAGSFVQVDETPINYCDPDAKVGKAKKGYLCGMSRPGDNVVFDWSTSRSTEAVTRLIADFRGHVQCDAYAAYQSFAKDRDHIQLVACMAHIRRKFRECLDKHPRYAALILRLIGNLYACEREYKRLELSPKLIEVRRSSEVAMQMSHLRKTLEIIRGKTLPSLELHGACNYALNQWVHMEAYLLHGEIPIDNNTMEQAIRPSALGKKNWTFIGSPEAGERPAIIYSVLISCQRFRHDPFAYLKDVLQRLCDEPDRHNPKCIAQLVPRNWRPVV